MKTLKTLFALAIVSLAGSAQAAPPLCSSVCSKKADCSQPCRVDHFAPIDCGRYHLCDPSTRQLSRIEKLLDPTPSRKATVREALDQISPS